MKEPDKFTEEDLIQLSMLRAQEVDELVCNGLLSSSSRFDESLLDSFSFTYPEVRLAIYTGKWYPAHQLNFSMENISLPRLVMDSLKIEVRKLISREGQEKNNIEAWRNRESDDAFGEFRFEMTALHVIQITEMALKAYRTPKSCPAHMDNSGDAIKLVCSNFKNDTISKTGIDLSRAQDDVTATAILGQTKEKICSNIPDQFRILHVESVLRQDLYSKFHRQQNEMRERLQKLALRELRQCVPKGQSISGSERKDDLIEYLVSPRLTFHGTSNSAIPSIVRHGFLEPGSINPITGDRHDIRCGSTYGRGVYSSPSAEFSLSYSGDQARPTTATGFWGLKLIVCATLMGRSCAMYRDDNWRLQSEPYPGADSHVANDDQEYIVFSSAQIVPCYVIHLDWGADNAQYFEEIPEDPKLWKPHSKVKQMILGPGDLERRKQQLMAKAAKYFPYGYGPATGTKFVVEDIGEIDDDEEDYGDYQHDRIDDVDDGETKHFWDWDMEEKMLDGDAMDEYKELRYSYGRMKP